MHDLFSAQDVTRSVIRLDRGAEIALLAQADAVITIQAEESEIIARELPKTKIILAPMAVEAVPAAQPGQSGTALFVGSNTLPNIDGINWFVSEVWPEIMRRHPAALLRIAGTCCGEVTSGIAGVELLGRVDDLGLLYAQAGVVVSPLREGSGLKIKLVEALGHGKAVIATETTLQGVKSLLAGVLLQADTAAEFIDALETVLDDGAARLVLGEKALQAARRHFSTVACYGGLLEYIRVVGCPDHVR
jgi:succinoglycan biosynthesis protein ExoO